jgi:hypothetical protein
MPKEQKSEKPASTYQETYNKRTPREIWCGQVHSTIEEAIVHAERNLGMRGKSAQPYWGTTRFSDSVVAGWMVNDRKRYRLDFANDFEAENRAAAEWAGTNLLKGSKGVHVNEENFDDPQHPSVSKVCHPTEASLQWADTYWNKWTRQYRQR